MYNFTLLISLYLAHIIFDFYLQPKSWIEARNSLHYKSKELYFHSLLQGGITFIVLIVMAKVNFNAILVYSLIIFITHYLFDLAKSYTDNSLKWFITDQIFHFLIITLLWLILINENTQIFVKLSFKEINYKYMIFIFSYIIIWKPVSILIYMLLKKWTPIVEEGSTLISAGKSIGYLERTLILTFILLNQFTAIGFLLAAKSIFRFGELQNDQDKKLTEYVMLGTLISFSISIFIGLATSYFVTQLPIGK
ncbi:MULTISPECIES: DUF3307 domain-containing protein [Proteus]|uniref:DUF3307 domain-containing protein n=1 Tax=Proteus penneri TaxID=102862 RepID=A0ABS0W3B9_9GAMM|nr:MULTISPECIES: DUF3307 domain-containing protein [Proteus]MBJ2117809.1 DUF3307 domain-containing protein [Proteus penneri]NBM03473.1 DUF3307 domain-containing protein [Proteus sp. G2671]NBM67328.1 DUF3307 domain-containing protein [Proteus sp. G2663]NBM87612.1 DUF3307 domain-containing protein [Proteus sp. G2661]NBM93522.1 DUF3307 domain-containing protein [Proteus sp. G2662]